MTCDTSTGVMHSLDRKIGLFSALFLLLFVCCFFVVDICFCSLLRNNNNSTNTKEEKVTNPTLLSE
jgi:hypothetical protein